MSFVTERMFSVTVTVDGVPIPGVFDGFAGGAVESDGADTYLAGGMADPEPLPGVPKTSEITLQRGYRGERDATWEKWLYGKLNMPMTVGKAALSPNKTPVPDGLITTRGILTGVSTPEHDSNGKAVTKLQLKMMPAGLPT
jgi:hypothetical protein